MNETLQQAAQVYASLAKEIKEAERDIERAKTALENLRNKQQAAANILGQSIGSMIPRKAFLIDCGAIVTIGYNEGIHVFEGGEEIR